MTSQSGRQTLSHLTSFTDTHQQLENVASEDRYVSTAAVEDKSPRTLRHISTLSLLSLTSIWGTLARLGLISLFTYPGCSVFPLLWAQVTGCLIIGFTLSTPTLESFYSPAYVMLTTGFCGSITTFSSWMLQVFQAFGDQKHYGRGGFANMLDAITQTGVTVGMSLISVAAGAGLGRLFTFKFNGRMTSKLVDYIAILLGLSFWIGTAILCALYQPYRHVTFPLLFSPPGTILRWYLSRLNKITFAQRHSIPLGTLAANLLATAIICAAFILQHAGRSFPAGQTACHALKGLQDGFCGCLSTVSTLAVELRGIAKDKGARSATRYAVLSWVLGILICVLLVGSTWWSIGMDGSCVVLT